jgi:hypothetical protein
MADIIPVLTDEQWKWVGQAYKTSGSAAKNKTDYIVGLIQPSLQNLSNKMANDMANSWKPVETADNKAKRLALADKLAAITPEQVQAIQDVIDNKAVITPVPTP